MLWFSNTVLCGQAVAALHFCSAAERDAAQQPAGLSVQMHPYQLQSLKFMLDAEKADGGWRQLFWKWLPHQMQQGPPGSSSASHAQVGPGRGVWWSPVLERVSYSVPSAPWGGFLAEEVSRYRPVPILVNHQPHLQRLAQFTRHADVCKARRDYAADTVC